jgi:lactoylglutathione lyase
MNINLLVLKTSRPDELASFYGQLGIEFEHHRHGTGPLHYAAEIEGLVFEIYPLPKDKDKADDTLRLGFTVEHLNNIFERLKNSGAKVVKEPAFTEWGHLAVVEDTDGRKIELKEMPIRSL